MTTTGSVSAMGYIALGSRDLPASTRMAADVLGLRSVENTATRAYLSAADTHHELVYVKSDVEGVDHIGLVAPDSDNLAAIREKVRRGGWRVLAEQPIEEHIEEGFAFIGPEGFTWHVYRGMSIFDNRTGGFGPDRYGHVNLKVRDSVAMVSFLVDVFGFTVSDRIGEDFAFFLRCNPEHHGIAVVKAAGHQPSLHHHAWQAQSITDLGKLADRLAKSGSRLFWGPTRHGAGHNIAAYYIEPGAALVELYTDMEMIYDPRRDAIVWAFEDPGWLSQWDGLSPENMLEFGVPTISR
ncbi:MULTISPECIES: VOC family protein [unclassified Microbacterium]|uniref:VOC family protein n=1 Tax=unclassified Microbacterium TaxID=2609290 RepID=UPI000C2C0395|nr:MULTISPECIES: VOC family protein [unclassified Microbacterium]